MTIAELILPSEILNHFEVTSVEVNKAAKIIDIYLDERSNPPSSTSSYISKGFTEATVVQDFPVRGKAVYLHVRRRKPA
jgi:transposase